MLVREHTDTETESSIYKHNKTFDKADTRPQTSVRAKAEH